MLQSRQSLAHLTVDRIGSRNDAAPCVEGGVNASFGDGDRLLLHDFVNGDPVDFRHFVKFVDTDHATVC